MQIFDCHQMILRGVDGSLSLASRSAGLVGSWAANVNFKLLSSKSRSVHKNCLVDRLPVDICKIPGGVTDPTLKPKHNFQAQKEERKCEKM